MGYEFYRYTRDDGSGNPIFYNRDGTQLFTVSKTGTIVTMEGGNTSGDEFYIKANTIDTWGVFRCPQTASSSFIMQVVSGGGFWFGVEGTLYGGFDDGAAGEFQIKTYGNTDLLLKPAGTGNVKFGTYAAITGETNAGFITIKDAAGNTRKLCVVA